MKIKSKIKINKKEFVKMLEYRKYLNSLNIEDIDLSEFTDRYITEKEIEDWKFTGLDNIDFIKMFL